MGVDEAECHQPDHRRWASHKQAPCGRPGFGENVPGPSVAWALARAIMWCVVNYGRRAMAWTTPTLVEICIGLEINGYLPAEF